MNLPHQPKPYFNVEGLRAVQKERLELGVRKNHDYSGTMDAIAIAGIEGLATRLLDKAARLHSLVQPGMEAKVTDESVRDTLMDIGNYADYGVSLSDGTWGKRPMDECSVAGPSLEETLLSHFLFGLRSKAAKQYRENHVWYGKNRYGEIHGFKKGDILGPVMAKALGQKTGMMLNTYQAKEAALRYAALK